MSSHTSNTSFNIASHKGLSRRAMLRGLGVTMALPLLESMVPGTTGKVLAQAADNVGRSTVGAAPTRMAMIFTPNGVNYDHWMPSGQGTRYQLSPTLKPLESVREHVNVMTGLTLDKARANGDGPGDHARSSATFLTGRQARKTDGNDIQLGISVDQFTADQIGDGTRLRSLELGCENGRPTGRCDSGYSCAYVSNIAWRDEDTPVPKMINPADVFELMFGDPEEAQAAGQRQERLRRRASVLDYVMQDTQRLERRLSASDKRKIDEFQTSIREIERRVQAASAQAGDKPVPNIQAPAGIPRDVAEHMDLMFDMQLLAFQMDITRVSTLMLGVGGSNRAFPEIGVKSGHHNLSHHRNQQDMVENIRKIDYFYMQRFARFVDKMAKTPDGDGTLLDHSMIMLGSGISDGNRHNHENLPIVMAGRANGTIDTGRLINYDPETPLCNLYLSMMDRMNVDCQSFGDSTGRLKGLTV